MCAHVTPINPECMQGAINFYQFQGRCMFFETAQFPYTWFLYSFQECYECLQGCFFSFF